MVKRLSWLLLLVIPVFVFVALSVSAAHARYSGAQPSADPTCSSSAACLEWDNSSNGPGLRGVSNSGNGVGGATKFNSTSASNATAGIYGADQSTLGGLNSGVEGLSSRGTGVSGITTSGAGVNGSATTGYGVKGTSSSYIGVTGSSSTYDGIYGSSTSGIGVVGNSAFVGVNAVGGFINGVGDVWPALSVLSQGDALAIAACSAAAANPCDIHHTYFAVDPSGDVFSNGLQTKSISVGNSICCLPANGDINISGHYQVNGKCVAGCAAATALSSGKAVISYSAQTTSPTIEDYGETQLVNGQAYVAVDAAFANVIDQHRLYLVFITPEGDSRGLYVTQKTLRGFEVRESQGGRSTIAFSYRIVAKPFGETRARLPMVTIPPAARFTVHGITNSASR